MEVMLQTLETFVTRIANAEKSTPVELKAMIKVAKILTDYHTAEPEAFNVKGFVSTEK